MLLHSQISRNGCMEANSGTPRIEGFHSLQTTCRSLHTRRNAASRLEFYRVAAPSERKTQTALAMRHNMNPLPAQNYILLAAITSEM